MTTEIVLSILPIVAAVGGWSIKQGVDGIKEAKANALEAKQSAALTAQAFHDLKELITTRFDALEEKQDERHTSFDYRLQRVEKSMNGFLHREEHSSVN